MVEWSFLRMEAVESVYVVLCRTVRDCLRRLHLSLRRFVGVDLTVAVGREG